MNLLLQVQNNSFVRHMVCSKNGTRTFLSSEQLPNDFSKILFYRSRLTMVPPSFLRFVIFGRTVYEEDNHKETIKMRHIRASLTMLSALNNNTANKSYYFLYKCK